MPPGCPQEPIGPQGMVAAVAPDALLVLFHEVADAVAAALAEVEDWGPSGRREGQYAADLIADAAALDRLRSAGVGVLSEESGLERADAEILVVIDPLDGSTNASRGVPWFATSMCALDAEGPFVALVVDQAHGTRFEAVRGEGARRDGVPMPVGGSHCGELHDAIVGLSGLPPRHLGWAQYRAFHAAALDLCAVADGVLDGFVDCSHDAHGVWDYLGALLVCREVGIEVIDAQGRELVVRDPDVRRTPVAGATRPLLDELLAARRGW